MGGCSVGGGGREGGLDVEDLGGKGSDREECIFACEGIALGVGKNSVELGRHFQLLVCIFLVG